MFRIRYVLAVAVMMNVVGAAPAGIFSRKPKVDPAERVPTLIMQLKTDKEDSKRAAAAEELRSFDPKAYPEMMTVLIDALIKDSAAGVRSDAASTIAKLRPISQQAGFALEQASANDPSLRVRMAARQALWQYNLVGYRSIRSNEAANAAAKTRTSAKFPLGGHRDSAEPPLAETPVVAAPLSAEPPMAEMPTKLQPVKTPKLLTPPRRTESKKPTEPEGPSLNPPA